MPVILKPGDEALWLNKECVDPEKLVPLLQPYASEAMNFYRVSIVVNNARSNSPECIEPANLEAEAAAEASEAAEKEAAKQAAKAARGASKKKSSLKVAETSDATEQGYLSDEQRDL